MDRDAPEQEILNLEETIVATTVGFRLFERSMRQSAEAFERFRETYRCAMPRWDLDAPSGGDDPEKT